MNFLEFQGGIERLRSRILGAQLQDFSIIDRELIFMFYLGKPCVLRISLKSPPVFFFEPEAFKLKSKEQKIPLDLFLKKHFLRAVVVDVRTKVNWGRRFEIHLKHDQTGISDKTISIEIVLVPGFQNLAAFADSKHIHWQKPRPLANMTVESTSEVSEFRSLDQIREEWYLESQSKVNAKLGEAGFSLSDTKRKIDKKTQAIEKIILQGEENRITIQRLYEIGELLKYQSLSELSSEYKKWINESESTEWNREYVFKKAKLLSAKENGMEARINILRAEVAALEAGPENIVPISKHKNMIAGSASVATRKYEVSETLSLYMGKNAKDNIQLLKSSQPWELWLHLKDYPSAYAITRRNKNSAVGANDLVKMATWFVKESFKHKKEPPPSHIEVIVAETRFVKLVKSDRIGRVTYTNAKTIRISMK